MRGERVKVGGSSLDEGLPGGIALGWVYPLQEPDSGPIRPFPGTGFLFRRYQPPTPSPHRAEALKISLLYQFRC
jgi:hypothetical protein